VFALDVVFTAIGFIVGGTVGLTGVGGGALMTPILLLLGISPALAVGTDLLYAALTKSAAVWIHHRNRTIQWRLVLLLSLGSIPAAALSVWLLRDLVSDTAGLNRVIVGTLSVSLILTAIVLLLRGRLHSFGSRHALPLVRRLHGPWRARTTIAGGFLIGVLVTISSVGAGALGAAILLLLYPRLLALRVVGTDIAHAVPLALVAGLGHFHLGNVDFSLLGSLLLGSLPGIYIGSRIGLQLPDRVLRPVLGSVLLVIGLGFAIAPPT
jgi:uncharacterized membrane protein YfcA